MAVPTRMPRLRVHDMCAVGKSSFTLTSRQLQRCQSSVATPTHQTVLHSTQPVSRQQAVKKTSEKKIPSLSRLPTATLLRNLMLGYFTTSPLLFKIGLAVLTRIANSSNALLNPDKNVFLRAIIRPLVYDHFCAGTNAAEVRKTIADIKAMGFTGVNLCYGKETIIETNSPSQSITSQTPSTSSPTTTDPAIAAWATGNMQTLSLLGANDYLALKLTGAGPAVVSALTANHPSPPPQLATALHALCTRAAAQNSRLWIDAEQACFQPAIDTWTIDLMRAHNRDHARGALVSNTIQAYLKSSRDNVARHLRLARRERWCLGVKLVRGAYMAKDARGLIHDSKAETDACYDSIARDLLARKWPGLFEGEGEEKTFPDVQLFLASHNAASIARAERLTRELVREGREVRPVGFGQLQGMADDVSCELLAAAAEAGEEDAARPQAYKYLTWGSVQECMQYLVRRAVENQGAAQRMKESMVEMRAELRRRMALF